MNHLARTRLAQSLQPRLLAKVGLAALVVMAAGLPISRAEAQSVPSTGNPQVDQMIAQLGIQAVCGMLNGGGGGEAMGAAAGPLGAICQQMGMMGGGVPLQSIGAPGGDMMGKMANKMMQQLMDKIMGGGGAGGESPSPDDQGPDIAEPNDDTVCDDGEKLVKTGDNRYRCVDENSYVANNGGSGNTVAGLNVIANTSAGGQSYNLTTTVNRLEASAGTAVGSTAQASAAFKSARAASTAMMGASARAAGSEGMSIGAFATSDMAGGIRLADGTPAMASGVRIGGFAEGGVQVAAAVGALNEADAQAQPVAMNLNPSMEAYKVGFEDAAAGRDRNPVFEGDADYESGYAAGLAQRANGTPVAMLQ